jgi:DNA-binding HxlR family transcriptional regulator
LRVASGGVTVASGAGRKCYTRDGEAKAGQPRSGCAINAPVEVIGARWSLLVLRDIMFGNRRHFRVLQEQSEEGIAFNILADRLRGLVEEGLLTRADAGRGRRSTYSLTEAAIEPIAVMAELGRWGALIWRRMNRRRIDGRRAVSAAPQEER